MFQDDEVVKQSDRFVRLYVHKSRSGNRALMDREKYEVPRCPYVILLKPTGEIHEIVLKREEVVEKKVAAADFAARLQACAVEFEKRKK